MDILYLADNTHFIPRLAQLLHDEWDFLYPNATVQTRYDRLVSYCNRGRIPLSFVAVEGDRLLGTYNIILSDMKEHPELSPWLASVYVLKEYRGRGIGTELVKHSMAQCKKLSIPRLYLWTDTQREFYERLGWKLLSHELYQTVEVDIMYFDNVKPRTIDASSSWPSFIA